jgi:hypothetical protein
MRSALVASFRDFMIFLEGDSLVLGAKAKRKPSMDWALSTQIAS